MGLSYCSPVRPLKSTALPSEPIKRVPSAESGCSRSNRRRIVGCRPASSSSSQWAPSNAGVDTPTPGVGCGTCLCLGDLGPVLVRLHAVPAPPGGVSEVGLEHLPHVHPAGHA